MDQVVGSLSCPRRWAHPLDTLCKSLESLKRISLKQQGEPSRDESNVLACKRCNLTKPLLFEDVVKIISADNKELGIFQAFG